MKSPPRAIVLVGSPCSGKTTYALSKRFAGFEYVGKDAFQNRSTAFHKHLVYLVEQETDIIIEDNNPTPNDRAVYINLIRDHSGSRRVGEYSIECHNLITSLADIRHNGRSRQSQGGDRLNSQSAIQFRRSYIEPSESEGFDAVVSVPFNRLSMSNYCNRAVFISLFSIIFSKCGQVYPTRPEDVGIYPYVNSVLSQYHKNGYKIILVGNIPGISLKYISEDNAHECLLEVVRLILSPVDDIFYSPYHSSAFHPTSLPNPYFANLAAHRHKLNLSRCIMVGGGSSTDRQFAVNSGFARYWKSQEFFRSGNTRIKSYDLLSEVKAAFSHDH